MIRKESVQSSVKIRNTLTWIEEEEAVEGNCKEDSMWTRSIPMRNTLATMMRRETMQCLVVEEKEEGETHNLWTMSMARQIDAEHVDVNTS